MTRKTYLESLSERVLVFDGAMGTSVQQYELTPEEFGGARLEGCNDYLCVVNPNVIEEIHASYLEAGADVLETGTFGSTRPKLEEYGIGEETYHQNFTAAQLARKVADAFSTDARPRYVAGSMGPTGFLPSADDPTLSNITYQQLKAIYKEQTQPLVEGGVDLLIIETTQDILELKAAINGAVEYFRESGRWVPIQAQVTLDTTGRMLLGTDIVASLTTLEALPVQIIGLNCSTGPEHMREPIRYLGQNATRWVSCIPNAGLPINVGGRAVYPLEPEPMAQALYEFVTEFGVSVVGGCCGTGPEHIRALVEALGKNRPQTARPSYRESHVSSGMRAIPLDQQPKPLIVGERVNAQGSRKVKRLLLSDDYDGVVAVGREQVEGGAHVLDVSVALTERPDEDEMLRAVTKKLSLSVEAPVMLDSTEASSLQAALEVYPGRAIINSINMERGRERIEAVLPLAVEHGSVVVALAIDEIGMAHTADRKAEICRRIYDIALEDYGLGADALIFDVLTFPVTTGQEDLARSALETLEGIRRVKTECPGSFTVLGVSNVSFGIEPHARAVLNSVFLHHAIEAGLDLAIVNPAHITPYAEVPEEQRRLADRLIENEPNALPEYIAYFEKNKPTGEGKNTQNEDELAALPVEERIHYSILHRRKEGIEALLEEALEKQDAVGVLNNVLLPAMKDVGDKFGAGELILPFVLQSAEVMKRAVAHLEQYFEKKEGYTKGKVVLATVFGDVHDIGKSLVNTILTNNGYTTYDLGKQVPLNVIVDKAVEVNATAIGLSALLVSTSKQMPLCVQELHKRGLEFPVLVGGAAINRPFGARIGFVGGEGERYLPGVYYCRDAFEGLDTMEALTDKGKREEFIAKRHAEAIAVRDREMKAEPEAAGSEEGKVRSNVREDVPVPTPPFWGYTVLDSRHIPIDEVFECLDLKSLYRLSWGAHKLHGAEYERVVREELEPRLKRMQYELRGRQILTPRVIYGYFPCQSDGNELIVYKPEGSSNGQEKGKLTPITRFVFPRQPDRERLCLADYYASVESGKVDVVPLQVVTMGDRATEVFMKMQAEGDYSEGYYIYGLSVALAEALAEWTHRRVTRELGLPPEQGRRYSWGYPACPDPEEQTKLMAVLPAEKIGVSLTEGSVLVPEQSTAALVAHHPQAKYYTTRPLNKGRALSEAEEEEAGRGYVEPEAVGAL